MVLWGETSEGETVSVILTQIVFLSCLWLVCALFHCSLVLCSEHRVLGKGATDKRKGGNWVSSCHVYSYSHCPTCTWAARNELLLIEGLCGSGQECLVSGAYAGERDIGGENKTKEKEEMLHHVKGRLLYFNMSFCGQACFFGHFCLVFAWHASRQLCLLKWQPWVVEKAATAACNICAMLTCLPEKVFLEEKRLLHEAILSIQRNTGPERGRGPMVGGGFLKVRYLSRIQFLKGCHTGNGASLLFTGSGGEGGERTSIAELKRHREREIPIIYKEVSTTKPTRMAITARRYGILNK